MKHQMNNKAMENNIHFKEFSISDIFIILGEQTKLTKGYIEKNKGEYPVYSGQVLTGDISNYLNSYKYDCECVIWTTYGSSAGYLKYVKGKFNIGRNASGLILKDEFINKIDMEWFKITHEHIFLQNIRADHKGQKRMPHQIVNNIKIKIPVNKNGDIDLIRQMEIKERYNKIFKIKNTIKSIKEDVKNIRIFIDNQDRAIKEFRIEELFNIKKGLSKYTKKYGNENKGIYEVYSASNNVVLTKINSYDYDGRYLTWASNGLGGYMKIINGKFSINGDRGLLIPKDDKILIDYVKYILQPILRNIAKGRRGENGKNEFTKVSTYMIKSVKIPMPIDDNGELDYNVQKKIAKKYEEMTQIKEILIEELEELICAKVELI